MKLIRFICVLTILFLTAGTIFSQAKVEEAKAVQEPVKTVLNMVWDEQEKGVTAWPFTQGREFDRTIPFAARCRRLGGVPRRYCVYVQTEKGCELP